MYNENLRKFTQIFTSKTVFYTFKSVFYTRFAGHIFSSRKIFAALFQINF